MIGKYKYSAETRNMVDIVRYVKSSVVDDGGTNQEAITAIKYASYDRAIYVQGISNFSRAFITNSLSNQWPIYVRIAMNTGHAVVLRGFDTSTDKVTLNNPTSSSRYYYPTYTQLVNGTWEDVRPYQSNLYSVTLM